MTAVEQRTHEAIQGIYKKLPDLNGVKLRDLFAMSAINGMSSNSDLNNHTLEDLAELAYKQADAMLEARKK